MHLGDMNDQIKALNNVYKHLSNGGRFIFDAFVPDLNHLIKGLDNVVDYEGEYEPGMKVKRTVSTQPDLINQTLYISFQLEWEDKEGWKSEEWKTSLRFFFRYELEHLVERSDFNSYTIFGDYLGNELGSDSKEFLVVCEK
jgi:hypothetical protein